MAAFTFVCDLLEVLPWRRLSTQHMVSLANHAFFHNFDWESFELQIPSATCKPPIVPGRSFRRPSTQFSALPVLPQHRSDVVKREVTSLHWCRNVCIPASSNHTEVRRMYCQRIFSSSNHVGPEQGRGNDTSTGRLTERWGPVR